MHHRAKLVVHARCDSNTEIISEEVVDMAQSPPPILFGIRTGVAPPHNKRSLQGLANV